MKKLSNKRLEVLLWSIAFPGFGQLINKKYVKGFLLVILEIIINLKGRINATIMNSFLLETDKAIQQANYSWFLFYPCIYLFAIWDAYRDAGEDIPQMSYLPYTVAAYAGTLGVIYSSSFQLFGFYFGPVFLPILTMIVGFFLGMFIRQHLLKTR